MQELKVELKNLLAQLDSKFESEISLLESRLTVKMGTMLAASIAILTTIQKLT